MTHDANRHPAPVRRPRRSAALLAVNGVVTLLAVGVVSLAAARTPAEAADPQPTASVRVAVAGIIITAVADDNPEGAALLDAKPGTRVAVVLDPASGWLVGHENFTLRGLRDDKGGDLLKGVDAKKAAGLRVAEREDGSRFAVVTVDTPRTPAAGAGKLTVAGSVELDLARATSSYTYLDLPLRPGLEVGYGLTPFSVEAVDREAGKPTRVTLRMSGTNVDRLRAVRLLTADGEKPLATGAASRGENKGALTFELKDDAKKVAVAVESWDAVQRIAVPIEVTSALIPRGSEAVTIEARPADAPPPTDAADAVPTAPTNDSE